MAISVFLSVEPEFGLKSVMTLINFWLSLSLRLLIGVKLSVKREKSSGFLIEEHWFSHKIQQLVRKFSARIFMSDLSMKIDGVT